MGHLEADEPPDRLRRRERAARRRERERAVAWHRKRQYGLTTRCQLVEAGWSEAAVTAHVRDGVLDAWQRGVFAPAGMPSTFDAEVMAAFLRLGPEAVVVGLTAARMWQLPDCHTIDVVEVALPRTRVPTLRRGVVVHGYPWLTDDHVVKLGRFRVLNPDHAVADLCRRWDADRVLDAAADLWRRNRGGGAEGLARAATQRGQFSGIVTLRQAVDRLDPAYARTRSIAEVRGYRHLDASDLPAPGVNVRMRMSSGRRWEFDFVWDDVPAILEIDGAHHARRGQRARDERKDADAAADGYLLRRIPAVITEDRAAFLLVVRQLLADAGHRRQGDPSTAVQEPCHRDAHMRAFR